MIGFVAFFICAGFQRSVEAGETIRRAEDIKSFVKFVRIDT